MARLLHRLILAWSATLVSEIAQQAEAKLVRRAAAGDTFGFIPQCMGSRAMAVVWLLPLIFRNRLELMALYLYLYSRLLRFPQ
jgi:hypothetical protein